MLGPSVRRGTSPGSLPAIRPARVEEYGTLRQIELEADRMFESVGIGPFVDDDSENHLAAAQRVLVAGDPAVGFVSIEMVDGLPHVWQLSVRPDHARRGIGRALMAAVRQWAVSQEFPAITLTTFRDVPWNGPFYASLGFEIIDDLSPELAAIREHERAIGDDEFAVRVAMRLEL